MKQHIKVCLECGKLTNHKILRSGCVRCLRCKKISKIGLENVMRMIRV